MKSHFPMTDKENLLLYYLGWIMSGRMRFAASEYNLSYQYDEVFQQAYNMIVREFGYTYNQIWNL